MIDKDNYVQLKKKYGHISSWAIWNTDYSNDQPKKNTADVSVFNDNHLLEKINTGYVLDAFKPTNCLRDLIKAGALIAAAIDRLQME